MDEERGSLDGLCSQSVDDKASDRAFLFFRYDHAIWFILQEKCASVPRALVFSALLLKKLRFLAFKVNEDIAIIFNAAIYCLDTHLLVEWDANQVNAPTTKSSNLSQRLTLFQRNKEIRAGHGRGHHLVNVVFKHLGHCLIFKVALCHPWD